MDHSGQQYGNYRLLHLLGRGAFAEVYLAEHIYLKTQAAIKTLHVQLTERELHSFLQEARTIAHLQHPHILSIKDFGLEGGTPFLVMQHAPNGSLRHLHPMNSQLPLATIVTYVRQIASALQYAHSQQIIHCDVKPENILPGQQHQLLLSDFGLAVLHSSAGKPGGELSNASFQERSLDSALAATILQSPWLQQVHEVGGTIPYMAPEQLHGHPCPASDQYALGICVYEWLTGSRPFSGTPMEIALQQLRAAPPPLSEKLPSIFPAVEDIVHKALAKDPSQRFSSVQVFANALEQASSFQNERKHTSHYAQPEQSASYNIGEITSVINRLSTVVAPETSTHPTWNIPYRRNPFFTGREDVLRRLYTELHEGKYRKNDQPYISSNRYTVLPLAISGLGGMGKTQTVIEYVYRHCSDYQVILWARAETYETLFSDIVTMASILGLPGQDGQELPLVVPEREAVAASERRWQDGQELPQIVAAVKQWLEEQTGWLLVLDNVEDMAIVHDFIPVTAQGHILLTTRMQVTGTLAHCIELEKMQPDEGALFLLRRARIIGQDASLADALNADYVEARDISQILDGLPLALDQAGAYIEETTCNLFDYLRRYHSQRALLLERRGTTHSEHPDPVATTWLLSFGKVEQSNPAACALLKLCAFLHPNGILEEIITNGASEPGSPLQPFAADPYQLDIAIATLRKFSLLRRNPETRTLNIHRLVQSVLKDTMDEQTQRSWAEYAVRAVSRTFPDAEQVAQWQLCQHCMPNVHLCLMLIERWQMVFPEAAHLLDQAGLYLLEHAQYAHAQIFLKKALAIRKHTGGSRHPDVAESLNNLAGVYLYQGMYTLAESLLKQALEIRQQLHGSVHLEVAIALNNLALLYNQQGRYALAEPLYKKALAVWEQICGLDHPDVARTLNNLALLYQVQHKYEQAEPLYRRGLTIWEHLRGPEHPDVATCLNNLALLYLRQGNYSQAEPLFQRVLAIREKTLGPCHPAVAHSLSYLAELYQHQGQYSHAELLYQQALDIRKHALGPEHPDVAQSFYDLARHYTVQGNYMQAEPLFQQALAIREQALGPHHPEVAAIVENYASLLATMQRKDEARKLAARAKTIRAKIARQRPATAGRGQKLVNMP
jgi:serine/threonine protein kinase/tetratricopeptide (TPR) repeat protein